MGQDGRRDEERQEDLYAAFDALGGQLVRGHVPACPVHC
jgi:hypothetical protein